MTSQQIARLAFWLLLLLQPLWHLWWSPPRIMAPWLATLLLTVPLLLPAIGLVRGWPNALFWGGVAALLHFCVGVSELAGDPSVTRLALAQIALTLGLIGGIGWHGLQQRKRARAAQAAASEP